MRILIGLASLVLAIGGLSACNSSGSPQSSSSCDAQCKSDYVAACAGSCAPITEIPSEIRSAVASALPPSPADDAPAEDAPSDIVDNYDTATCADWAVTIADDKQLAALYYAARYSDPQPDQDAASLVTAIDTTCSAYGVKETPAHVAKVTIAAVYGGD